MGCDIHVAVEVKKKGKWKVVLWDKFIAYNYNDPSSYDKLSTEDKVADALCHRNYNWFGVMAEGVRSHVYPAISVPKGWPEDSPAVKLHIKQDQMSDDERDATYEKLGHNYYLGDHSFSWLSLKEILDYNWEAGGTDCGLVTESIYLKWIEEGRKGCPPEYCAEAGGNVLIITEKEYMAVNGSKFNTLGPLEQYIYQKQLESNESYQELVDGKIKQIYIDVEWHIPVWQDMESFYKIVIPYLKTLDDNPENVRLIFGFDS